MPIVSGIENKTEPFFVRDSLYWKTPGHFSTGLIQILMLFSILAVSNMSEIDLAIAKILDDQLITLYELSKS